MRSIKTSSNRTSIIGAIVCLTLLNAPGILSATSESADYTVSHQVIDLGGGRSASADYTNHGSIGGSGGPEQSSANYPARPGFIGQIHDAPIVRIASADGLSRTDGTLRGSVNPNTLDSVAWFEFGPVGEFTDILPLIDLEADTMAEAVSALVASLNPGTEYQFRLVAANADGTVRSPTQVFSTVVNLPPVADPVTLERLRGLSAKILVSELLGGVIDPEGDSITFGAAAALSANGGQIFVSGGWVLYQPPFEFNESDSFTYTIADSFGAQTTGTIQIVIRGPGNEPTLNVRGLETIPESGGQVRVRFTGVPGRIYEIQATENLSEPWVTIATQTADSSGLYDYIDEDAGDYSQRFYRAVRN
jgi:hypothetical protein